MLGFLKTIFGGRTSPRGSAGLATPRTVCTPPPPSEPARKTAQTTWPGQKAPTPTAPEPVPTAPEVESTDASGSDIDISLQSVLNGLPADLKDRVRDLDIRGATMTISLERILAQLPTGSVTISFGSLRQAAPQLFTVGAEHDSRDVALPLNEILAKINPAMICPPAQPARGTGETLAPELPDLETTQRTSTLSVPPVSTPGEGVEPPQAIPTAPRKVTPKPAAKRRSKRAPAPQPAELSEESPRPTQSVPCVNEQEAIAPTPSDPMPVELAALVASQPAVAEFRPAGGTSALAAPDTIASPEVSTAQPAPDQSVMRILLKELTALWPENFRAEVAHWNLDQLMVALPADRVNAALRQGKVVFSWADLRSWILPAPPSASSLRDNVVLELPLPVIMPMFLATRKQSPRQIATPQIADDIPDPFADFLPPARQPRETAAPPAPEKSSKTNFFSREQKSGDTGSRRHQAETAAPIAPTENPPPAQPQTSTPVEVLTAAMTLEGVAGALIALSDGFKVASKLPAGIDGDALAAFLPHIFSKVNQSTRQLRMGDLSNLNFTVDNVPWKIFRVNQIYFAALGHAGTPMPTDQLATLAHKLNFKN